MGRFKKGDWVRRTDGSSMTTINGLHEAGFVGQVADVVEDYGSCLNFTNGHRGYADKYEPWRPKVGERVRVIYGHGWNGEGELVKVSDFDCFIVLMKSGDQSGREGGFMLKDLEPILTPEKPAALKIVAGKFYKTRDGRKVGPMIVLNPRVWTFYEVSGDGRLWQSNGTGSNQAVGEDLIAEWIDEPVAQPVIKPTFANISTATTTTASNDNATPKFKVGDRVRGVINPIEYEVLKVHANGSLDVRACGSWCKYTNQRAMDFVNITRSTTVVALIENGQPKPSSTPHVHTSTGAAEKEAKRLAAKYKGQQFGVFTLTTTHEESAPVYDHKWQNLAVLGLKIDAIKELRSITGMGLKPAKDAVEYFLDAA